MSWFFGGRDGFLMVLLTFMVIDQFSGLAAGLAEHKISSEAGFKGILKKCLILAFVGMAHLMDTYLFAHTVFGEHETARNVIALFYHVDNIEADGSALTKQPRNFTLNENTEITYKNTTQLQKKRA